MSKYEPLKEFLMSEKQSEIKLSFWKLRESWNLTCPIALILTTHGGQMAGTVRQKVGWVRAILLKVWIFQIEPSYFVDRTSRRSRNKPFLIKTIKSNISDTEKVPVQPPHITPNTSLTVCGYEFHFVQQLIPQCENGRVKNTRHRKNTLNVMVCHLALMDQGHFAGSLFVLTHSGCIFVGGSESDYLYWWNFKLAKAI